MDSAYLSHLRASVDQIRADGFYKSERTIRTPQSPAIELAGGSRVINFCANNYLGLADDARLVAAAKDGLDRYGFGMASVRFICGTQTTHKALEAALAAFLRTDDSILYGSCFDANGGLFETLLGEEDAVVSDELNHASIVDGIRLCKAKRYRYRNNDMADLAAKLTEADAAGAERRSTAASKGGSTSSREPWARRWAAHRAAILRVERKSSSSCGSGRVRICSPTPSRRASRRHRCACSSSCRATKGGGCARASRRTASASAAR